MIDTSGDSLPSHSRYSHCCHSTSCISLSNQEHYTTMLTRVLILRWMRPSTEVLWIPKLISQLYTPIYWHTGSVMTTLGCCFALWDSWLVPV
jgi:hypothetical protein